MGVNILGDEHSSVRGQLSLGIGLGDLGATIRSRLGLWFLEQLDLSIRLLVGSGRSEDVVARHGSQVDGRLRAAGSWSDGLVRVRRPLAPGVCKYELAWVRLKDKGQGWGRSYVHGVKS